MSEYEVSPEELQKFFDTLDGVAKFRFATPFVDLNREDRIEVLRVFELAYSCGFLGYPDAGGVNISFDGMAEQMDMLKGGAENGC